MCVRVFWQLLCGEDVAEKDFVYVAGFQVGASLEGAFDRERTQFDRIEARDGPHKVSEGRAYCRNNVDGW